MTSQVGTPLPQPSQLTKPHWEGCREGKLRFQRCGECGAAIFIPQPLCTECQADALEWQESSGRGTLYSWTTVHRPQIPAFQCPYTVAIVELEEGWHMLSNLVDCPDDERKIGMALEVVYEERSPEITLPLFRPAKG